jgi:predicted ATPase
MKAKKRIPKIGDRVSAMGHDGAYLVYLIDEGLHSADLKKIGDDERLATIQWTSLIFLDKEDASQAAARIVKEATENQ